MADEAALPKTTAEFEQAMMNAIRTYEQMKVSKPTPAPAGPPADAPRLQLPHAAKAQSYGNCVECGGLGSIVKHMDTFLCHKCGILYDDSGQKLGKRIDVIHLPPEEPEPAGTATV